MTRTPALLALLVAGATTWWLARVAPPAPPSTPPPAAAPVAPVAVDTTPAPPPELPDAPELDRERARDVYVQAASLGSPEPGLAAFRDHTEAYLDHHRELAEAHARAEGLTRAEVAELTNLALIAQRMQHWGAVEALVERPVPREARHLVAGLLRGDSEELKLRLREQLAAGATEPARAATIREVWGHTRAEYFALTGMDAAKLDRLLADAVIGTALEPEGLDEADAAAANDGLAAGEVAEVLDEPAPEARLVVIDRVTAPTGEALVALEREAATNPRLAAELARDRRR